MRLRLLPASLLALGVATLAATAATGQEIRFLAFGDSITVGYGDTSNPGGGYPPRLQRWLRQQGYDAIVESHGVGGETTSSGLSRIDSVLADGGDFLLLMEGTNDISQRVGIESIRFNLDEMASRAEALGMVAVHASVIPRVPTAPADASNAATSALALAIRNMGEEVHRAVADQFTLFEGLPDVFANYYYYDPDVIDVVGHPNTDGYIEIAGLFLETLLPLLDTPAIVIVPPPGPLTAAALSAFGIDGNAVDQFVKIEWDFGDGGYATTPPPADLSTFYMYLHPGTYTVTVRGSTAGGAVSEDSVRVVVAGSEPAWATSSELIPLIAESADGQLVSDLSLSNSGNDFGVIEATFIPEIVYDSPPPVRRFVVAPQTPIRIAEILATGFGIGAGRGAMQITLFALPGGNPADLGARALVRSASDPDGSDGADVGGLPESSWTSAGKQILGIPFGSTTSATLAVANLDGVRGTVSFDLVDGVGGYIGSGVLELGANAARLRPLSDLFRDLSQRPTPFKATFHPATIRFSAAALVTGPTTSRVRVLTAAPQP
ncbi:MAG: GDSL-type esterase/lipase family protein [Thermoanaerobaculia bacterium]